MPPKPFTNSSRQKSFLRYGLAVLFALSWVGCSKAIQEQASQPAHAELSTLAGDEQTALDRYVAAPDTNYAFHLVRTIPGKGQTTFLLEMTSQAWLTTNEVDRPV